MNTPAIAPPVGIDLDHLRQWIGRVRTERDSAAVRHARLMAATVDRASAELQAGDALPPLWHWLYFLEGLPPSALGGDGHPARGGFLPPVPLPNRMWAGGRVAFEASIPLGAEMERRSQVSSVDHKRGRAGDLVFVTVLHELFVDGVRCIREEHDIVYKQPTPASAVAAAAPEPRPAAPHTRAWTPDSTQLFRYSALTFNGHRIHYDQDYCRNVEGYDNLVVHGPLSATMLAAFAAERGGRPLKRFAYRGLKPSLLGAAIALNADVDGDKVALWTALPGGQVSMQADAELQ